MGNSSCSSSPRFLGWATAEHDHPRINWLSATPVWVEQWSLSIEKLRGLKSLVEEQLNKGHIVPTNSPWNSPMFILPKPKRNGWRLLHDLRKINAVMEDMGPLQPGMPSPSMLPHIWKLAVIDIKDCFFHIPLHPSNAPRFAFSGSLLISKPPCADIIGQCCPRARKTAPAFANCMLCRSCPLSGNRQSSSITWMTSLCVPQMRHT